LGEPSLGRQIAQALLFGRTPMFDLAGAGDPVVSGGRLSLPHTTGGFSLDTSGTLVISQPAIAADAPSTGLRPIIEEDLQAKLAVALRVAGGSLDLVDPTGRASAVLPLASVTDPLAWLTRAEYAASPNRMALTMRTQPVSVALNPAVRRRASLLADPDSMAEDFVVLLRDEIKTSRLGA
jgi:hypothetical protein